MQQITPAIFTRAISKRYGSLTALESFDLTVERGGIFGLLGPNGAGKTTLIRILTTLMRPDGGEVRIEGLDPSRDGREIRRLIGVVPQENSLDRYLTARENLELREQDTIRIFSRWDMVEKPVVSINGLVLKPGSYDFYPKMTVRDLVVAAGSLKRNAQPIVFSSGRGPLALAHNGNLVNSTELRDNLMRQGVGFSSSSDSEVMTMMLARDAGASFQVKRIGGEEAWFHYIPVCQVDAASFLPGNNGNVNQ